MTSCPSTFHSEDFNASGAAEASGSQGDSMMTPTTPGAAVRKSTISGSPACRLLEIEVAALPGRGKLTLTGNLREVMKESARAALWVTEGHRRRLAIATPPGM